MRRPSCKSYPYYPVQNNIFTRYPSRTKRQRFPTSKKTAAEGPARKKKRGDKDKADENACPNENNPESVVQDTPSTSNQRNGAVGTEHNSEAPAPKRKRARKDKEDLKAAANETNPEKEDVVPSTAVTQPNDIVASSSHNKSSTGRSSFWERRKVWNIDELLAETENIQPQAARNIVKLFEDENTIPFICRYAIIDIFILALIFMCLLTGTVEIWWITSLQIALEIFGIRTQRSSICGKELRILLVNCSVKTS